MGSYAELYVGRLLAASSKNDVMPDIVGLFQRDEFHSVEPGSPQVPGPLKAHYLETPDDPEAEGSFVSQIHYYATNLSEIRERLEYLGYSSENVRKAFYAWRDRNVAWKREMVETYQDRPTKAFGKELQREATELSRISLEDWVEATKELISSGSRESLSVKARKVLNLVGGEYDLDYGPNYDYLISLRVICDFAHPNEVICYDITDLVHSEYLAVGEDPTGILREHEFDSAADIFRNSKTIVLVEGKSDIRLLKTAMTKIFPRLADRFVFFDYEEFGIPGGAGNLVNLVKSFIAAGVANRIVALFDNDTGAEEALLSIQSIELPRNLKIIKLPDIDLLHEYPTIGPGGSYKLNISGVAAGIELYLGSDILTRNDGTLREIRWTGYSKKAGEYQGELVEKAEVQNLFLKKLAGRSSSALRQDNEMRHFNDILWSIITAFNQELGDDIVQHAESAL